MRVRVHTAIVFVALAFLGTPNAFLLAPNKNAFVAQRSSFLSSRLGAAYNEGHCAVFRSESDGEPPNEYQLAYRIVRPMALSSRQAAPMVVLHGGPSVPSDYLYPLEQVI